MIDTTGKCSACGHTVGIGTIHTCSPQVTAPTPERRVVEAVNETDAGNHDEPMTVKEAAEWAKNSRALRNFGDERAFQRCCQTIRVREEALARLTAEVARLREFAEKMITPCEWGPSAFIEEDESDISDWALSHGLLVERVHAQPCEVEGCECDGSPTLLYFAWSPEAAALALPTPAPEATDGVRG